MQRLGRAWAAIPGAILLVIVVVAIALVAANCCHIDFIEDDASKTVINLWRIREGMLNDVDLCGAPLDDANVRINKI